MVEQILTQEEIDALLNDIDSRKVDISKDSPPDARSYDLILQRMTLRYGFDALNKVHNNFINLLNSSLPSFLQRPIKVKDISREIVTFGEFLHTFPKPTGFSIYSMEPLVGNALLAVDSQLAFALIECMHGGVGRSLGEPRDFTRIEQRALSRFYSAVLTELQRAWQIAYRIKVVQKRTETKTEFVNMGSLDDPVLIFVLSINSEEFSGNIHICTPLLMLDSIKDKLSSHCLQESDHIHAFEPEITELIKDIKVELVAELGRTVSSIGKILELEKNDIVRLNTGPRDPVVIKVEGELKYFGAPCLVKGNRAVQISKLVRNTLGD